MQCSAAFSPLQVVTEEGACMCHKSPHALQGGNKYPEQLPTTLHIDQRAKLEQRDAMRCPLSLLLAPSRQ
eukprot:551860-Amphidinium_carterae.1